jgi:hypothetical protein
MTDLAKRAGVPVSAFQDWFEEADWIALINLGWRPDRRVLTPVLVKYICDKFLPDYIP